MNPPMGSALICVRDREGYIGEAIASALVQTVPRAR
jgi:hypothetical protein